MREVRTQVVCGVCGRMEGTWDRFWRALDTALAWELDFIQWTLGDPRRGFPGSELQTCSERWWVLHEVTKLLSDQTDCSTKPGAQIPSLTPIPLHQPAFVGNLPTFSSLHLFSLPFPLSPSRHWVCLGCSCSPHRVTELCCRPRPI